jgi:hypothetical protein
MSERIADARILGDIVGYLEQPTGMQLLRGTRAADPGGLLELTPDAAAVAVSIPRPPAGLPTLTVPVRVSGMNPRWSVGLYQYEGYRTHYYSNGDSGYRALGVDFDGRAYAPLFVSKAARTRVLMGHPVIADAAGAELFIQVTRVNDGLDGKAPAWHLSVNNPTDRPVTATLTRTMALTGLEFAGETITLQPGEYRVLQNGAK